MGSSDTDMDQSINDDLPTTNYANFQGSYLQHYIFDYNKFNALRAGRATTRTVPYNYFLSRPAMRVYRLQRAKRILLRIITAGLVMVALLNAVSKSLLGLMVFLFAICGIAVFVGVVAVLTSVACLMREGED